MGNSQTTSSTFGISIIHYTDVHEYINGGSKRIVARPPSVLLELETTFVGPYTKNWLYVSAESKSMLHNKQTLVDVPYRPDMVSVEQFDYDETRTYWHLSDTLSGYRSWRKAKNALVIVSGGVYGGRVAIVEVNEITNTVITARPFMHNVNYEAVYMVPIVKGYYKSFIMEKDRISAEIETFKEYMYG